MDDEGLASEIPAQKMCGALRGNRIMPAMTTPATDWYLLSLRPAGAHAGLRAATARVGGRLLALSPWRIEHERGVQAQRDLQAALAAPTTLFTSPAAAAAAAAIDPAFAGKLRQAIAVGEGTARVLRRYGVPEVAVPARMDSEGVLALPPLATGRGAVGLVTAPGGRGMIWRDLEARGIQTLRADVYRRVPIALSAQAVRHLRAVVDHSVLALSSGEALQQLLPQLPADLLEPLRQRPVVAASERLVAFAQANGFIDTHRAAGPMPAQLAGAAAAAMTSTHS
jgi:uroporphyrinogen-III synthase